MTSTGRPRTPWARFDDLRAGTAVQCPTPHRVLVAERPDQVVGVLAEVERATDSGSWAFGYIAYEAAAGLDPHLPVHLSGPVGMPLVWFGLATNPPGAAPRRRRAGPVACSCAVAPDVDARGACARRRPHP